MTHPFRDSRDAALAQIRALEEELAARRAQNEAKLLELKSSYLLRRVPKRFDVNNVQVLPAAIGLVLWYGGLAYAHLTLRFPIERLGLLSILGAFATATVAFGGGVFVRSLRARRLRARIAALESEALTLRDPLRVRVEREVLDDETLEAVQRRVGELEELLAPLRDRTR